MNNDNHSQELKQQSAYEHWQKFLEDPDLDLKLPFDRLKQYADCASYASVSQQFEKETDRKLKDFCLSHHSSVTVAVNSALAFLIGKYCNTDKVPVVNFNFPDGNNAHDIYLNCYFLKMSDEMNFLQLLDFVNHQINQSVAISNVAINEFNELYRKQNEAPALPTIPVIIKIGEGDHQSKSNSPFPGSESMNYCLLLEYDSSSFTMYFNQSLFEEESIGRMLKNLQTLLINLGENSNLSLNNVEYISSTEKEIIFKRFNERQKNYYTDYSYISYFKEQVAADPGKAIAWEDNETLTYGELDLISDRIAKSLLKSKSDYIGLITGQGFGTIIGLVSILKSNKCVIAINSKYPQKRIQCIIDECKIDLCLTCDYYYEYIKDTVSGCETKIEVLLADKKKFTEPDETNSLSLPRDISPDRPCYVIYTSGTTGKPKGIVITHRNFMILYLWFKEYLGLDERLKSFQNLSYSFDFGMFDILSSLLCRGTLYFINRNAIKNFNDYVLFMNEHQINNICTTPGFFTILSSFNIQMPSLEILHLGGEKLTYNHIQQFSKVIPNTCRIYNGYGPSECTINSTIYQISEDDQKGSNSQKYKSVPIGKPSANNYVYILDENDLPVPIGVPGELCIAGDGLGLGYLNNEILTKEKFKVNVFNKNELMYYSGDLVKWLPSGDIEFLDRKDEQLKISGYRIEIGEIENYLLTHEQIKQSAVVVIKKKDTSYLCAVLVTKTVLKETDINNFLLKYFPYYMIPKKISFMDALPLTVNGKVDKRKLIETIS